jgi:hypothetical protein
MPSQATQCARCQMPISDPTTEVSRGGKTFCCGNCAAAASGGASDPGPRAAECCAECGVPIVDESTMQTRVGERFCCANCLNAMETFAEPTDLGGTERATPL